MLIFWIPFLVISTSIEAIEYEYCSDGIRPWSVGALSPTNQSLFKVNTFRGSRSKSCKFDLLHFDNKTRMRDAVAIYRHDKEQIVEISNVKEEGLYFLSLNQSKHFPIYLNLNQSENDTQEINGPKVVPVQRKLKDCLRLRGIDELQVNGVRYAWLNRHPESNILGISNITLNKDKDEIMIEKTSCNCFRNGKVVFSCAFNKDLVFKTIAFL